MEAGENCSFLNRRGLSLFERETERQREIQKERERKNSTRGPAHDKTKRLNDL